LADAWGRKRVILGAIVIFCLASVASSAAHTMGQLILFRGLQGLGAGGIMPVALTILGDVFSIEERAKIQGFFSAVWGSAALAGPALGALLVNTLGWRAIFYVNLPLGLVALWMLMWKYSDREKPHSTELDFGGAMLLTVSCTTLLAFVSALGSGQWPWSWMISLVVVSAVTMGIFIWHEGRIKSPLLSPSLIGRRDILPAMLASMLLGLSFLSLDVYVPLYVQGARGGGAAAAAGVVTPVILTWAVSSFFAAPWVVRAGFRKTAIVGGGIVMLSFLGLLICSIVSAPHWVLTLVLAGAGMGFGPSSMAMLLAAQDAVTWQHRGVVTGAVAFFRTIGGAVGIGLLGGLFNFSIQDHVADLRSRGVTPAALLDPHQRSGFTPELLASAQSSIADGLIWVFAAMLLGAAALAAACWMMPNRKTAALSKTEALEAAMG
jgi:MFS family permease